MTSARKVKANRINARASTGPRSVKGKARSSQNARRHGLSLPISLHPDLSAEAEKLALEIAGEEADVPGILDCARRVAEAQIDLLRVRRARHEFFFRDLNNPDYQIIEPYRAPKGRYQTLIRLAKCFAYRLRKTKGRPPVMPVVPADFFDPPKLNFYKPVGAQKTAHILCGLTTKRLLMDRYERRALSRRKFAIRAYDAARCQWETNKDDTITSL